MVRTLLVAVSVALCALRASALSQLEMGAAMSVRAYDAICWYETLKQFPSTSTDGFMTCLGSAKNVQSQMSGDDDIKTYFGQWMIDMAMGDIPSEYATACNEYLRDMNRPATSNEAKTLNDGGGSYPYQGFAYCMLSALRNKFGQKAIDAVENEKTIRTKNWMQTLLDRDNEFRARHGSPPMTLNRELTSAAQSWADNMASKCDMYHSSNDDQSTWFQGQVTGESLSSGPDVSKEDAAYIASDGWYEEIKDYPYPDGYTGDGSDDLFEHIGHFTQTVWKGTKLVGYGIAYNRNCDMKFYIAGRYSPAGNMAGDYQTNVLPPQD